MISSRFLFVEEFEGNLDVVVLDHEVFDFVEDHLDATIDDEPEYSFKAVINGFIATRIRFLAVDEQSRKRIVRAVREIKEETLNEIWNVNNGG